MATTIYVSSKVSLQCRVDEKPLYPTNTVKEGRQIHHQWDCRTAIIEINEWYWRFETAKQVLCSGTTPGGETYTGDVVGGDWDPATDHISVNEDKFNER